MALWQKIRRIFLLRPDQDCTTELRFEPLERRLQLTLSPVGADIDLGDSNSTDAIRIATATNGNAVAVWSSPGSDSMLDVFAQRLDSNGAAIGDPILVNVDASRDQFAPDVAVDANGNFVVVWTSLDGPGTTGIFERRFDSSGGAQTGEIKVSDINQNSTARVSLLPDDSAAIAFDWNYAMLQFTDASGALRGAQIRVSGINDVTTVTAVSADADGNVAVLYDRSAGISGRRYDSMGNPLGASVDVAATSAAINDVDVAARPDKSLVITWLQSANTDYDVFAGRYAADLTKIGSGLIAHTALNTSVSADSAGNYALAYTFHSGSSKNLILRTYDSGGTQAQSFNINENPAAARITPGIAYTQDGSLNVISRSSSTTATTVLARHYQSFTNPAKLGDRIFKDANANGVQDAGETGIAAGIRLFNSAGLEIATASSNANGQFSFSNVMPGQQVYLQHIPASIYVFSPKGQGGDSSLDSDIDPLTNRSDLLTLAPNESRTDLDVGLIPAATMSGNVYYDADRNGIKSPLEPAQKLCRVFLDLDLNGVWDSNEPVTTTSNIGTFTFSTLRPGTYNILPFARDQWDPPQAVPVSLIVGQAKTGITVPITTPALSSQPVVNGQFVNIAPIGTIGDIIAYDSNHDFAVVWDQKPSGSDKYDVYARLYAADGLPRGSAFRVNAYLTDDQIVSSVAFDPAGNFIVVYNSFGQDGSFYGVYARRFDHAGQPLANEFLVNTTTFSSQAGGSVAFLPSGEFVIVWTNQVAGSDDDVVARRFTADGTPLSGEIVLNGYKAGLQFAGNAVVEPAGNYLVVWDSGGDIYARRFNPDLSPIADEFRVNTTTDGEQRAGVVRVASNTGDVLFSWEGPDGLNTGVYTQRFDAKGQPMGQETQVVWLLTGYAVSMDAQGNFTFASAPGGHIDLTMYNRAGVLIYNQTIRNSAADNLTSVAIAMASDGDMAVAWAETGPETNAVGLDIQRLAFAPVALPNLQYLNTPPSITVKFSETLAAPLDSSQIALQNLTTGHLLSTSDFSIQYDALSLTARIVLGSLAEDGSYRLSIPAANALDVSGHSLAAPVSFDFFILAGDANHDRAIDFGDLVAVAQNYGSETGATYAKGDFNYDGKVDFADLVLIAQKYGTILATPAAGAIPAPIVVSNEGLSKTGAVASTALAAKKTIFSTAFVVKPAVAVKKFIPPRHR